LLGSEVDADELEREPRSDRDTIICVTTQILSDPSVEQFELAADTFKLMADKTRLRIIWALLHGEHSVNELALRLNLNPAGVSQHLARLRSARVVIVRRDANRAFYSLENNHVRHLVEQALFHADHVVASELVDFDESTHQSQVPV
jgi:DNA-binding transcriptional ArsR family regulator